MNVKKSFLEDIKHLYPDGVDGRDQHRDLIRVYSMGWASGLKSAQENSGGSVVAELNKWVEECRPIAQPDWRPDLSWEWMI